MKRVKYKRRVPRYGNGGGLDVAAQGATVLGEGLAMNPYNENGSVNDGRYITGKTLSRAGQGAALGSVVGPVGTAVGAGVGAVVGVIEGITGSKKLQKQRDQELAAQEEERKRQEAEAARLAEEERIRKENEQKAWNQSYAAAHPELRGGTQAGLYLAGGGLIPVASDVSVAKGPKHESGGIDLKNNGQVVAEIEGEEVIHDRNVFSDRLKMGKKTYAEHAEQLGKKKGKLEKLAISGNFRDKNTAERMLANIDNDLDNLFQMQEASKTPQMRYGGKVPKYGNAGTLEFDPLNPNSEGPGLGYQSGSTVTDSDDPERFMSRSSNPQEGEYTTYTGRSSSPGTPGEVGGSGQGFNWKAAGDVVSAAVPFIDNIFNAQMIKKTPEIPKPTYRSAYEMKAMPMRTNVDISSQLADVNSYYRDFTNNIDAHTSNSNVGRANKVVGFAKTLRERNNLFTDKYNKETDLINKNNQNIQAVENANIRNKQDIDNYNKGLTDRYNMDKVMREDNILKARSQNVSNATEDAMKLIQDRNDRTLDQQRIMTDALKYNDASGYARMIGTDTMDELMRNPNYYAQVDQALKNSGQTDAYNRFQKRYGKKKSR